MLNQLSKKSLKLHKKNKGKFEVNSKIPLDSIDALSWAYSPGVAAPCKAIEENHETVYDYTAKGNMVAVVTDGSAVLGLGNIGPKAAMPVMEGKSALFKEFAGVDAFPICLNTQDPEEIIDTIKNIAPGFGGINLEDIASPQCVEIENRLKDELDIPVFHDDQHGTAIVTLAALINSCKLTGKKLTDLKVVLSGTGAAGASIARILKASGVRSIVANKKDGIVTKDKIASYDSVVTALLEENIIDSPKDNATFESLFNNADVFVGVSVGDIVTKEMIQRMNTDPFIFAMANPDPEIKPSVALEAGAHIIGTGRSDYPNQINNVLAFPGIFKGALEARASNITENMKIAAAKGIANVIHDKDLSPDYIIPSPFDNRVVDAVKEAVRKQAKGEKLEL